MAPLEYIYLPGSVSIWQWSKFKLLHIKNEFCQNSLALSRQFYNSTLSLLDRRRGAKRRGDWQAGSAVQCVLGCAGQTGRLVGLTWRPFECNLRQWQQQHPWPVFHLARFQCLLCLSVWLYCVYSERCKVGRKTIKLTFGGSATNAAAATRRREAQPDLTCDEDDTRTLKV